MGSEDYKLKIDVFAYLDYRIFLSDITRELKANTKFNLRAFAASAGIKAPGYLKMVIDGRRNITDEMATKFCHALGIHDREQVFFETLVRYNQTSDPDLKKKYFDEIIKLKPRSREFMNQKRENRYYSCPYYVSVREMVALGDFKEDYKWIAKRCFPQISPAQAREAVTTLLELGLLKRDDAGKLVQTESFVHTQDKNTQIAETYHFHESVLDKARHALGSLPQNERNYYALTLPLPQSMFNEIIDEFYAFRDKIVNKLNAHQGTLDEVYQINFQLFPATRKTSGDK